MNQKLCSAVFCTGNPFSPNNVGRHFQTLCVCVLFKTKIYFKNISNVNDRPLIFEAKNMYVGIPKWKFDIQWYTVLQIRSLCTFFCQIFMPGQFFNKFFMHFARWETSSWEHPFVEYSSFFYHMQVAVLKFLSNHL